MKHRLFVEQPNLDMKPGICVDKDTELIYKNKTVEQVIKDLKFETIKHENGSNGINAYETKSLIKIGLNEGDILLFDKRIGYYLPYSPVTSIDDAIDEMESLREFAGLEVDESVLVEENEDEIKRNEEDNPCAN